MVIVYSLGHMQQGRDVHLSPVLKKIQDLEDIPRGQALSPPERLDRLVFASPSGGRMPERMGTGGSWIRNWATL